MRLGRRAGTVVRERFGWERAAARFIEVCEYAAAAHPGRAVLYRKERGATGLVQAQTNEAGSSERVYRSIGI